MAPVLPVGVGVDWRRVLEWENEMRLSPAVQARVREAEMSSERDWIEVAVDVQREVLARFGLPPTEVNLEMLRRQATSETR